MIENEWHRQWRELENSGAEELFFNLVHPNTLDTFKGKDVLDAGCGQGKNSRIIARVAGQLTAFDLNTADLAADRLAPYENVDVFQGDVSDVALNREFDIVLCIGVIMCTKDPRKAFLNLAGLVKPGGRFIIHVYAGEISPFIRYVFDPLRKILIGIPFLKRNMHFVSRLATLICSPVFHAAHKLKIRSGLWGYMAFLGSLPFSGKVDHVYDKINPNTVRYISKEEIKTWCREAGFEIKSMNNYHNVAWCVTMVRR